MKRKTKILLFTSLLFNLLVLIFIGPKVYRKIAGNKSNNGDRHEYSMDRNLYFETLPSDSNAIVFLGTSITQNFELHEAFDVPHLQNRGINGDWLGGMIRRLYPLVDQKPRKFFIEAGINDLCDQQLSEEKILEYFETLFTKIHQRSPETKVYVLSILPVSTDNKGMSGYSGEEINLSINSLNTKIKNKAAEFNCTFIDTHSSFVRDGEMQENLTIDGVHLSGAGYSLYGKILKPYVIED